MKVINTGLCVYPESISKVLCKSAGVAPKQGYQWPDQKDLCPPTFLKKKKICHQLHRSTWEFNMGCIGV